MARPDTKDEQTILQNLWIMANKRPEGVNVPCGDASSAKRLRFALYNAVKYHKGVDARPCSEQLSDAIANCSLSFTDDGAGVIIRQKIATKVNQAILSVLGDFPILSDEDRQLQESSQRLLERIESENTHDVSPLATATAMAYGARK
jgi:hypothetical protein